MIKLNNKNITYVALADSNNSIKAPKEIWYADSANSVKLVYRRKDALIEGEDYEKYHWLDGDGSAYIDTGVTSYNGVVDIKLSVGSFVGPILGRSLGNDGDYSKRFFVGRYAFYGIYGNNQAPSTLIVNDSVLLTIDIDNSIATDNYGNTTSISIIGNVVGNSMYLFCSNKDNVPVTPIFNGKIGLFNISSIINLIPCKLLKPVPKWLDANGIRRQVGECGMIDLVSGKFYGNVNSNGTFTVENYYERKEWLVGDGSAYIDTNIIVDVPSLYISTSFTKKSGGQTPLFGSRDSVSSNGSHIWYLSNGKLRLDIVTNEGSYIYVESNDVQNINQLIVDCPNNVVSVNGTDISNEVANLSIKNSTNTFKIFSLEVLGKDAATSNTPYHGAFGNFILNDSTHSINLIPCTLTMDLPASMDANNIARTKGTSGMWDLVSDRFYGNVANSGTFKAVNLAEGVDYEVHQWLKGDGSAYIDTDIIVNAATLKLEFECNNTLVATTASGCICGSRDRSVANSSETTAIHYINNQQYRLDIFITGDDTVVYPKNDIDSFRIDLSANTAVISGTTISSTKNHTNSVRTFRIFGCYSADKGYTGGLTNFKIDDSIHNLNLIPVKLLRSIPAKYDANGIARQAGECGMYDTLNDVFHGNVANSGTFSVSDDN